MKLIVYSESRRTNGGEQLQLRAERTYIRYLHHTLDREMIVHPGT